MNTVEILKTHNAWRRGDDTRTQDELGFSVTELGMAIDDAVRIIDERDKLRAELEECIRAWALTTSELAQERERRCDGLANFNPDRDQLEACRDSLLEHRYIVKALRAELEIERGRVKVLAENLTNARDILIGINDDPEVLNVYKVHFDILDIAAFDSALSAGEGGRAVTFTQLYTLLTHLYIRFGIIGTVDSDNAAANRD